MRRIGFNLVYASKINLPTCIRPKSIKYNLQVGSKRKRECDPGDVSRGAVQARQFLKKFSELPLDKMDLKQALQEVRTLKNDLKKDAVDCQWLQQFF